MKIIHLSKEEITYILDACYKSDKYIHTPIMEKIKQEVEDLFNLYWDGHSGQFEKKNNNRG